MTNLTIGDLAQSYALRRQNVILKDQLSQASTELTTGRTSDLVGKLGGDFRYLDSLTQSLRQLDAFEIAASEAASFSETMQLTLGNLQNRTETLATSILSSQASSLPAIRESVAQAATDSFGSMISDLNVQIAGRSLFAGTATDGPALDEPGTILADIRTALSGATSVSDATQRLDDWFNLAGGGFETVAYVGSGTDLNAIRISPTEEVSLSLRADDPVLREALMFTAMAAFATDAAVFTDPALQTELLQTAAEGLLSTQDQLSGVRGDLGFTEARIAESQSRLGAERTSLEFATNELLAIDPFEAAAKLEETQAQLETLYTITARMSRLSLVEFLR